MTILNWEWKTARLKKDLEGCKSILELGCGKTSYLEDYPAYKVGVDIWKPYLEEAKRKKIYDLCVLSDALGYIKTLRHSSFDAVFMDALIEHLPYQDALNLLSLTPLIARKVVVLTTPNGFVPHDEIDSNPYQKHTVGFDTEYLKYYGYDVYGLYGWKALRTSRGGLTGVSKIRPVLLGETVCNLTQYWTYKHTNQAYVLYAVRSSQVVR